MSATPRCRRRLAGAFALTLLALGGAARAAAPAATPLPHVSGPIPVTATSRIYMAAADARAPLELSGFGYVEEEFFFSGKANVYDWAKSGEVAVRSANAPYATRMLVRRPADPKRFSGTVWVEFLNPVARTDMSLAWGYANYYMMDHGDAYVGVTAFPDSIQTLQRFDGQRYASLSMANPAPLANGCAEAGKDYSATWEEGLRWDMLSQAGALLKSRTPGRPLANMPVQALLLFGQSNGDLPTYVSAFHRLARLANGKPVWDGYLVKDSGIPMRANQCDARPAADDPRRVLQNISSPVMVVVVENSTLNNLASRRADSDAPGDRYRRYEIPGASHVDNAVFAWLPKPAIMNAIGVNPLWPEDRACTPRENLSDFPIHYYVSGAMLNLDRWVRKGVVPPRADRIRVAGVDSAHPVIERDAFGNALGGVRDAYVEVPVASYNGAGPCGSSAHEEPFGWQKLDEVYGSYRNFARKFAAAVDVDVQNHWVPDAYAARMKAGQLAMPTLEKSWLAAPAAPTPRAAE